METRVNVKGQITIPATLRQRLNLTPGTRLTIEIDGLRLILIPAKSSPTPEYVHSLRGKYSLMGALPALMADRQREREL